MVADVYFDRKQDASNYGGNYHYDTHNLVHAHDVGQFSRDEFMVAPEQIELKYILEIDKGHLIKPKRLEEQQVDLPDLNLDGLTAGDTLGK